MINGSPIFSASLYNRMSPLKPNASFSPSSSTSPIQFSANQDGLKKLEEFIGRLSLVQPSQIVPGSVSLEGSNADCTQLSMIFKIGDGPRSLYRFNYESRHNTPGLQDGSRHFIISSLNENAQELSNQQAEYLIYNPRYGNHAGSISYKLVNSNASVDVDIASGSEGFALFRRHSPELDWFKESMTRTRALKASGFLDDRALTLIK